MVMESMSKKKRLAISMALALGTILPPFGGTVNAGGTTEIDVDDSAPAWGGSSSDDAVTVDSYTLILKSMVTNYTGELYGGRHLGEGDVKNNTLKIENGAVLEATGYGGFVAGGTPQVKGSAIENHVIVDGGKTKDIYGGMTKTKNGDASKNTVEINDNSTINGSVYGGAIDNDYTDTDTDVKENQVTLRGTKATTTVTGDIIGGYMKEYAHDVANNGVTIEGGKVSGDVFGAKIDQYGSVENNVVTMRGDSEVCSLIGGYVEDMGHANSNTVSLQAGKVTDDVAGGLAGTSGSADAKNNTVTITGGEVGGRVYGGGAKGGGGGKANDNTVTITGGKVNGSVYGGYSTSSDATGNTVTITGGEVNASVYAGHSVSGTTTHNTVNLGDGEHAMTAGYSLGQIYGGSHAADVAGNTLNVKTNVKGTNIYNFETINFEKNASFDKTKPFLTIDGSSSTTIKSLSGVNLTGAEGLWGTYTLINRTTGGFTITDGESSRSKTKENTEQFLSIDGANKNLLCTVYQFKDVTATEATALDDGTALCAGRSKMGNSTVNNTLTMGSGTYTKVYGGKTEGTGTPETDKGDSRNNSVTVTGGEITTVLYGGYTDFASGIATGNTVTITGGKVDGTVYGGYSASGAATHNTVNLGDGKNAMAAGYRLSHILGGNQSSDVTGNTLNVKTNVDVRAIHNFATINFYNNGSVNKTNPFLTISASSPTTIKSLSGVNLTGFEGLQGTYTLINNNTGGFTINDGKRTKTEMMGVTERSIFIDSADKNLLCTIYQFKDVTATQATALDDGSGALYAGRSKMGNSTVNNKLTMGSGNYTDVFGGKTEGTGTPETDQNQSRDNSVTVTGGTITNALYGGYTSIGTGSAIRNTVTITGGNVHGVYGGFVAPGTGKTTHNTVNLGDGKNVMAAGYSLGRIYGGSHAADVTGNTLNVKAHVEADNILHFDKIKFYKNASINAATPLLKLTDSLGTTIKSIDSIETEGIFGKYTLMENPNGIALDSGPATKSTTTENTEINIRKTGTQILSEVYQFKDADFTQETGAIDGTDLYAGRSTAGNSTLNNQLTVESSETYHSVYGGNTEGTGTPESEKGNSRKNRVTLKNAIMDNLYGGSTDFTNGEATDNTVTITGGKVNGSVYGGYSASGKSIRNTVNLGDGKHAMTGGYSLGRIFGGNQSSDVTGNTLNVNTNVKADNILNFDKIRFQKNDSFVAGTPLLELNGGVQTTIKNLSNIEIDGFLGKYIVMKNTYGITITDGDAPLIDTTGNREKNLRKDGTDKILYEMYQFKDVDATQATATVDDNNRYAGRSKAGNSTVNNKLTIDTSDTYDEVAGGSTTGTGTMASEKGNSRNNHITLKRGTVNNNLYGGATDFTSGEATDNSVTITGGQVNGHVYGGFSASGKTIRNTVNLGDGINAMTAGYHLDEIYGGNQADVAGNTLNVKTNVEAKNIKNFEKINFYYNASFAAGTPLLKLTDGAGTTIQSLTNIEMEGFLGKYTVMENAAGITISDGGAPLSNTAGNREKNLKKVGTDKILYEVYQFKDVDATQATATVDGTNRYAGRSTAGNSTVNNKLTIDTSDTYDEVAGGSTTGTGTTASEKGNSRNNHVTLKRGTVNTNLYGGATDFTSGEATDNSVTITGGQVNGHVYGGYSASGKTIRNTVNLGDGINAMTAGYHLDEIYGGNQADVAGNILNVKTNVEAKNIKNFEKINFHYNTSFAAGTPLLKLTDVAGTTIQSLTNIEMEGFLGKYTVMENAAGITISDGGTPLIDTAGNREKNIQKDGTGKKILYEVYQFKDVDATQATATVDGTNRYAGRSKAGNSTIDNKLTIDTSDTYDEVAGGSTTGTGTTASEKGNSRNNHVTLKRGTVNTNLYGGATDFIDGKATGNTVTVEGGSVNDVFGGDAPFGEASGNIVDLGPVAVTGDVFGGRGGAGKRTDRNIVHLRGTNVTGTVTGGSTAAGTGNTLIVHSHVGGSSIGDFQGFQNVHFYIENDAVSPVIPMLTINNTADLTGKGIGVKVDGGAKVLKVGEAVRLLQTTGALTADAAIENQLKGSHGSSMRYEFTITKDALDDKALIATVTKAGMDEETTKSFTETRAALTDFVNHGGDILAGSSLAAATTAAASAQGRPTMDRYQVWAGMGGSAMRAETGSYVDTNGWSFNLGWAMQNATASGKTLFSPFVEYGRGSYNSYLDNGVHGSGGISYLGLGLLARAEQESGLWYEGSIRGGRATSDYRSTIGADDVSYDGSNTYYAAHLGLGKDIRVKDATITPYLRYFYSHQNGMTATLSGGEVYDFGSVNSHRLRLGVQYAHAVSDANEFYAGLAYEYEFNGEATATFQGYSTPSPSLKGSSGMLELGYRFTPADGPLSYDLHFTGWQGVRRGFSGGAQVTWAF